MMRRERTMTTRTQEDRDFDLECGRDFERKDAEIMWLRSALASLAILAEAETSPLTNKHVASICKVALSKYPR